MNSEPTSRASEHESIEARAAAWLAECDAGLTPEQVNDFSAWRAEDPRHEAAVARLESAWEALGQLREFRPEARLHPDPDLLAPVEDSKVVPFPWKPVLAAAAAAALAVTAFFSWDRQQLTVTEGEPQVQKVVAAQTNYETTVGGYLRATLPDGSVVELNENSEIDLVFSSNERRVKLLSGEVHFAVAKNKERPFVVEAHGLDVRAVGTAFNVKMGQRAVEVLVTEGTVQLQGGLDEQLPTESWPAMVAGDWTSVPLQDRVSLPGVQRLSSDAMRDLLSWQGNRLVFIKTPLAEAVDQFNRRNRVQIQIDDPELAAVLIEGSFQADNSEAFIRLIAGARGFRVTRPSADVVVLQQAR